MKRFLKAKDFCAWFSQWRRSCSFQKEANWSQIVSQWASNFICQLQHVPSACYAVFVCILLDLRKSLTANVPRKRKSWWKTLHCFPRYPLTWLELTDARINVAADLESNEIEGHYRNKTKITKLGVELRILQHHLYTFGALSMCIRNLEFSLAGDQKIVASLFNVLFCKGKFLQRWSSG